MSDHIPFELQEEVIQRVPIKALLKFRCVSKEWKALIDSPDFADDYCLRHSQPHLLIRYDPVGQDEQFTTVTSYLTIAADDDTFHQHRFPLPKSVNNLMVSEIVGCSHGLLCFYRSESPMAVIWNPWIRKSVDVPVPRVLFDWYQTILGFGVSPQTKDPMIVKIVKIDTVRRPYTNTSVPTPWQVEVFTLSSGTWKTPACSINNLLCRNSIIFDWDQVALDGFIYWLAFEWIEVDHRCRHHNLIMSFDLSREQFQEVCLPDNLAHIGRKKLSIVKRMESVVVLAETGTYGVWMMGQGVAKSFTRLFNVRTRGSSPFCRLRGFLKNGEPIVDHGSDALFAYDSNSERIKDLGIVGVGHDVRFSVMSYMETLLLIDQ